MQLGYGFVHVKEGTLLGYFADDLQQKGVRKRGGKVQGDPRGWPLSQPGSSTLMAMRSQAHSH